MSQRAANAYRKVDLESAPKDQVLVRLLDRFVLDVSHAREAITRRDIPAKAAAIDHAARILVELQASLDHEASPDLCGRLAGLYGFANDRLNAANLTLNPAPLDEAAKIIEVLAAAFREAQGR